MDHFALSQRESKATTQGQKMLKKKRPPIFFYIPPIKKIYGYTCQNLQLTRRREAGHLQGPTPTAGWADLGPELLGEGLQGDLARANGRGFLARGCFLTLQSCRLTTSVGQDRLAASGDDFGRAGPPGNLP